MSKDYQKVRDQLVSEPKIWLVTGVAGFIGSHLLEELLLLGQRVIGVDNFATGYRHNLGHVRSSVGEEKWQQFVLFEGSVTDFDLCLKAVKGVDCVLHQAALGSVPRSIDNPLDSNKANIDGFLTVLVAAKNSGVKSFVYASSSSVYGDEERLPKREEIIGKPLSPYAVTKLVNEIYAENFAQVYGFPTIGLRYFNVFGPRQDPDGAYAAVIPRWIKQLIDGRQVQIFGDGKTSRDFCYIANIVQANILACCADNQQAKNKVYNIAVGESTSLVELYNYLSECYSEVARKKPAQSEPAFMDFRPGDVRHSLANIERAKELLGYQPSENVCEGLKKTFSWFYANDPGRTTVS
ncbi:MAG: SDR family oxidoreductase [Deltaproteobacteria bacterium]|nr:SDR family oxidoreductase [Deltaproteobacteria bacterium]